MRNKLREILDELKRQTNKTAYAFMDIHYKWS